jgi:class 3 adenylate cyclase
MGAHGVGATSVRCPQCHTENRADRRFCAGCGVALERACASCGFKNALADRFCGGCGKPLSSEASPKETASQPARAAPERRPVAVLIADLANFTRLSTGRDPEDTQRLLARYFEAVDPIVLQHGGTIDKHMGDAIMALFGAPTAHGDDALRAARAAIAIHRRMGELSRETGESFGAHIGIALGEVLAGHFGSAGHAAYTVTGDAPTLATRLMEAAPTGETWVDDAIAGEIAAQVPCRPLPSLSLKGLDSTTAHAIVQQANVQQSGAAAPQLRRMIGRRGELAQINALMSEAGEGNGGAVLVRGDPGIGKSTLLQEAALEAGSRAFAVLTARVLDFGATHETAPATALCAHLLQQCTGEDGEAGLAAVLRAGDLAQELALFASDLLLLKRSAEELALYRAMDEAMREAGKAKALQSLLAAAARRRPQLIIVEDVHWADAALLRGLSQLAAGLVDQAALLLMSTRIDGDPIDIAWRAQGRNALLATIDLRPLSGADAAKLARHLSAESEDYMRRCVERAEGNPLFLEQLLRSRATDQEGHLPPSVHGVVLARLDRLAPADRRAIEAAAILGQRFRTSDLSALLGDAAYEPVELARRHLVRSEGAEIAFAHALVRDGVYASLTHERRAQFHRAAAALFAAQDPAVSAEHLERAGDPTAPVAYLQASKAEAALMHVARALGLAERGLAIAGSPADIHRLAMQAGSLQRNLGQGEPALASYQKAHEQAADEKQRVAATIGIASAHRLLGRVAAGREQVEALSPRIAALGDDALAAEYHTLRGNLAFSAADLELCKASHQAALAAAERAGSVEWRIRALGGLGDAAYAEGYHATARRCFAECADLADANGFIRIASPNRGMLANCEVYFLAIAEAERQCELALAGARRIGDRYLEMFAKECSAFSLWVAERHEQLADTSSEALAMSRALKTDRYTTVLLCCLAIALRHSRPYPELAALCQEALELAHRTSLTFVGPMVYAIQALIEPEPNRQAELIAEGETLLKKTALSHNQAYFYRFAMDWALEHGHWSEAERFADNLARYYAAREPLPYIDLLVHRARALAALGRDPRNQQALARVTALRETARAHGIQIPFPPLND